MRREAKEKHRYESLSLAKVSKGTDTLEKKRRGVERSSNASYSNGLAQIGSEMSRHEKEKLRAAKQRHRVDRNGNAKKRHCTVGKVRGAMESHCNQ